MGGKASSKLSKFGGGGGSSLPGMVARRIYPPVLKYLAGQGNKGVIMVIGTNGKTTTNNMIAKILQTDQRRVVHNEEGANLINGITACFVRHANIRGKIKFDYASLEVDEATFPKVVQEVSPQVVVVINFFPDQLDRYGQLDDTVQMISKTLDSLQDVTLVLNADDPMVVQLGHGSRHRVLYFGVAGQNSQTGGTSSQGGCLCPQCGVALDYGFIHYSQLGGYQCPQCNFKRPKPAVEVLNVTASDHTLQMEVYDQQQSTTVTMHTAGFYNVYNALAAFTVGKLLGIDAATIKQALEKYHPALGRMEKFRYKDKPVVLNLVKNSTGMSEALATMLGGGGTKDIMIAINDHGADGRDISWLWDVDFESLLYPLSELTGFVCSGTRAEEVAVRLKYAGVPLEKITVVNNPESGVKAVLQGEGDSAFVLCAYTALWPARSALGRLAEKEEGERAVGLSSVS